jgi:hypothetical protein
MYPSRTRGGLSVYETRTEECGMQVSRAAFHSGSDGPSTIGTVPFEYHALIENGSLGTVEVPEGRLLIVDHELAVSPRQVRAARAVGLSPRSYVDAVLEDEHGVAELRSRLDVS